MTEQTLMRRPRESSREEWLTQALARVENQLKQCEEEGTVPFEARDLATFREYLLDQLDRSRLAASVRLFPSHALMDASAFVVA
jgi:hypothetical protein